METSARDLQETVFGSVSSSRNVIIVNCAPKVNSRLTKPHSRPIIWTKINVDRRVVIHIMRAFSFQYQVCIVALWREVSVLEIKAEVYGYIPNDCWRGTKIFNVKRTDWREAGLNKHDLRSRHFNHVAFNDGEDVRPAAFFDNGSLSLRQFGLLFGKLGLDFSFQELSFGGSKLSFSSYSLPLSFAESRHKRQQQ